MENSQIQTNTPDYIKKLSTFYKLTKITIFRYELKFTDKYNKL